MWEDDTNVFTAELKNATCSIHSATASSGSINPLNAELNPICPLLELLGAHHILHVSRIRVKWPQQFDTSCDSRYNRVIVPLKHVVGAAVGISERFQY
jgi:hypothetical protein